MGPWINYHHLYYFKIIAELGSVSRAAEKLRLGQPTLSAQLKQLEESLDIKLFDRKHRKLLLTEQGRIALTYATNVFKLGSEMVEAIHDRLKPLKPTIHIGALDSIPKQVILKLVKLALHLSPCQITLSEGNANELLRELTAHRMDLMLTNFLPNGIEARGLLPKSISKNHVSFFGSPKFRKLRKGFPGSLSEVPLIFPTYDSRMRQDLEHWAKINGVTTNIIAESQDISLKKLMATHGLGLIPAASHTVAAQVSRGELIEIGKLKGVQEELFLVSTQRKIENFLSVSLKEKFFV